MKVEYINPFVEASMNVLNSCCTLTSKLGKLSIKPLNFKSGNKVVLIGVTGEVKGQVFIDFNDGIAKTLVSKMIGFNIEEVDELAESALAELGNMIMGNAATLFSKGGYNIDITPPTVAKGDMSFDLKGFEHICIPIIVQEEEIDMHIAIR